MFFFFLLFCIPGKFTFFRHSYRETKAPEAPKRSAPVLTLQQRVAEFDLAPKIIPTYEKATQTVSLQTYSDNEDEQDIPIMSSSEPREEKPKEPLKASEGSSKRENKEEQEELSAVEIQRILYSQELAEFLDDASRVTQRAMLINNKFDVLANYKGEVGDDQEGSDHKISLQNTLADERWTKNRAITSLNWSPKVCAG